MNLFKKITSLFLALLILCSTLGFTINKMVCCKSGKTIISFVPLKECCSKKGTSKHTVKFKCCDIQNTSFELNNPIVSKKATIPVVENIHLLYSNTTFFSNQKTPTLSIAAFADNPPGLFGRQLLSFISILNI